MGKYKSLQTANVVQGPIGKLGGNKMVSLQNDLKLCGRGKEKEDSARNLKFLSGKEGM